MNIISHPVTYMNCDVFDELQQEDIIYWCISTKRRMVWVLDHARICAVSVRSVVKSILLKNPNPSEDSFLNYVALEDLEQTSLFC